MQGLVSRAEAINSNPKYLYSVCSIVVFGSYLKENDRLGDLDVAIELSPRIHDADERTKAHLRYARESGRRFSNFTDEPYWAEAEVYQVLKARRRTVSFQPWYAFLRMEEETGLPAPRRHGRCGQNRTGSEGCREEAVDQMIHHVHFPRKNN